MLTPPLCASVSPLVKRGTSNPFGKALRHFCQGVPGHEGAGWVTLATVMTSLPTLGTALTWEFLSTHERGEGPLLSLRSELAVANPQNLLCTSSAPRLTSYPYLSSKKRKGIPR